MIDAGPDPSPVTPRAFHLVLTAVIGVSIAGYFVGVRHGPALPEVATFSGAAPTVHADAVPSMTYAEFDRRRYGPNRDWRSALADLDRQDAPAPRSRWESPAMHESFLQTRAGRRAYDGAPPVVPHPIEQVSVAACMACHGEARYVGRQTFAPAMSHEAHTNCTQCHVEQTSARFEPSTPAGNTFVGKVMPERSTRTWSGAPPTVPHSLLMRENCLSCHGPAGIRAIRTEHPWDAVCLQCHLPAALHTQFARPETLRRLGALESLLRSLEELDAQEK
ncbi:MAG: nitrate reductase cytochrome c-type subunit [Phycisphaeraceae bacterium]|nr:nitrate reductase cytochrome c-type subunit [Phycisphaeraceae bacterium]